VRGVGRSDNLKQRENKEGYFQFLFKNSFTFQDEPSKQKVGSSMLFCLLFLYALFKTNVLN
jgi:hypothetical protein